HPLPGRTVAGVGGVAEVKSSTRSGGMNLARRFNAGIPWAIVISSRQRRLNYPAGYCSIVADATRSFSNI
ncbi:MAG: hypothetical protein ABI596_09020, partial [Pyrinomonadaceae bacterium]